MWRNPFDQGKRALTVAAMGRAGVGTGRTYGGHAKRAFTAAALEIYGRVCHLCGRQNATEVDHLIPQSVRPDLRYDMANVRPACRSCNAERKAKPLLASYRAEGWA